MKTRLGFVSNSSSSAFIVAFDKPPTRWAEIMSLLFTPDQEHYVSPYSDASWSVSTVARTVYDGMKQPADYQAILNAIERGWFDGIPSYPRAPSGETDEERRIRWGAYRKESNTAAKKLADRFIADNPGKIFYIFEYSDEDQYGSALEHGELFNRLPHLKISYH